MLSLRALVKRLGIPINPGFGGKPVAQDTTPATPPFAGVTLDCCRRSRRRGAAPRLQQRRRRQSLVQLQAHYPPAQWGYTLEVIKTGRHALMVSL